MTKEAIRGAVDEAVDELVMVMEEVDRRVAEGADQIATFGRGYQGCQKREKLTGPKIFRPDLVDPLRF